jgi:hypothetical protein
MDKDGKVYFGISDKNTAEKKDIIDMVNTAKNLGLTDAEKKNFSNNPTAYIGVPFSQLKSLLDRAPDQWSHIVMPGIPTQDSTNNELRDWIQAAVAAFQGEKMFIQVKGDNSATYPSFSGVLWAFKKNDQLKFQLITSPIAAPPGTELEKFQAKTGSKSTN